MQIFKKKNLSNNFIEASTDFNLDKHPIGSTAIIVGVGILAGLSFYLFNKFKNTETFKTNDNIIIHTTKLEN